MSDDDTQPLGPLTTAEGDYLSAAANWLALAEQEFEELKDGVLQEGGREYIPRGGGYALLTEGTARLAGLNIAMAKACGDFRDRQPVTQLSTAPTPADATSLAAVIQEQMAADAAAHEAVTIQPWKDPEPESEGDLWAVGEGWFYYSTAPRAGGNRWLLIRHYAQYLRWRDEKGTKPLASVWRPDVAQDTSENGEPVVLSRPTAEERTAFYGPEPDQGPSGVGCLSPAESTTPEPDEMYSEGAARALERCSKAAQAAGKERTAQWLYTCAKASRHGIVEWPAAPAYKGPVVHVNALADLGDREFEQLLTMAGEERRRRREENGVDIVPRGASDWVASTITEPPGFDARPWRSPGGAGQWNG